MRAYLPPTDSIVTIDFSPTAGSQFHLADGNGDNKVNELDFVWRRDFHICGADLRTRVFRRRTTIGMAQ